MVLFLMSTSNFCLANIIIEIRILEIFCSQKNIKQFNTLYCTYKTLSLSQKLGVLRTNHCDIRYLLYNPKNLQIPP